MSDYTLWWLLAGGAVILELLTGTFYLLMMALGLAFAAVAAHAGAGMVGQTVVAAVTGSLAVALWYFYRRRHPVGKTAESNPDVNLDIGITLHVTDANQWRSDGTVTLRYRGADWTGQLAVNATPQAGPYIVEQVQGSRLILRNA